MLALGGILSVRFGLAIALLLRPCGHVGGRGGNERSGNVAQYTFGAGVAPVRRSVRQSHFLSLFEKLMLCQWSLRFESLTGAIEYRPEE